MKIKTISIIAALSLAALALAACGKKAEQPAAQSASEKSASVTESSSSAEVSSASVEASSASEQNSADGVKRDNIIKVGVLTLDLDRFEVMVDNKRVDLTLREYEVLKFLASEPGQVVSREVLLEKVWGYEYYGDIRTVDVTVRRIREKIEKDTSDPKILMTKRSVGYYIAV